MSYKTFIYWMRSQLDDLYGWAANPGPVVQSLNFVVVQSLSCVSLLATQWTAAHQAPRSMGFPRQEYWSGVPLHSPKIDLKR